MTPKEFEKHLARCKMQISRMMRSDGLPYMVGSRLVDMMKTNFQTQSFFGRKWKDVKRRTHPTKWQLRHADSQRLILTGRTGNLGRSIQFKPTNGEVTIFSDVVYSAVHNWGGRAGRGGRTVIPQRQFIGKHPRVDKEVMRIIDNAIKKIL